MKLAIFSRNLPYALGGAERSLFEEVKHSYDFSEIQCTYLYQKDLEDLRIDYSIFSNLKETKLFSRFVFSKFAYYEYLLNRKLIKSWIKTSEHDLLIAQNRWAPAAILEAKKKGIKTVYYLRDESSCGFIVNYHQGVKKYLKKAYQLIEYPAIRSYIQDNKKAIQSSDKVIVNSEYMSKVVKRNFGIDSEIVLPYIDKKKLKEEYSGLQNNDRDESNCRQKRVVLIGDTLIKGIQTFIKLAKENKDALFICYGKGNKEERVDGNIVYKKWTANIAEPYYNADLVIVPSIWNEAFGRVAVEATALGVPVLVSDKGGLPEAVGYNKQMIASTFDDFNNKVRIILGL